MTEKAGGMRCLLTGMLTVYLRPMQEGGGHEL